MSFPTAFHAIQHQAEHNPEVEAILSEELSISYAALEKLSHQVGGFLSSKGIERTDRVLVALPQGVLMAVTALGVMRHATIVPINPDYTTKEIERLLESVQPKLILTNEGLGAIIKACTNLGDIPIVEIAWDTDGALRLEDVPAPLSEGGLSLPSAEDTALLLLTSGSTSTPKLVPLTHANILTSTQNLIASLQLTPADRCLNMMTMFHVGGLLDLLIAPLTIGCTVMCPKEKGSKTFFEQFRVFRPTWYQCVPTMLADMVSYAELHPSSVEGHTAFRFIRSVSSPISKELMQRAEKVFGVPIIEIYGMTETAGVITSNPLPPAERKLGSVGKVVGATQVKVIDAQNNPLPANRVGEVTVSGEHVFAGYLDHGDQNRHLFVGKWFKTGDTGLMDEDGYLFLKGRVKEMINRGGEKISPVEIDHIIESHPAVAEAAAFAIPHPTLGEEVAAAVVLQSGQTLSAEELTEFLSEQLTQFKLPRVIRFMPKLPRNSGGKIQRHLLTQNYSEDADAVKEIGDAPETELEKLVAALWMKILEVKQVKRHDDFFDLGGDSLRALLFISELEGKLKTTVDPKVIYEHPVLIDLTHYIEAQKLYTAPEQTEDLHKELKRLMAHWPGSRHNDRSLIVGRNTLGSKTPIFWCTNGVDYFEGQVKFLDPDQPIYGMVSLIESKYRSVENNERAAGIYAQEIIELYPNGDVIIGGWCEGAKIVIDTARIAKEAGVNVKLLFMQDNFIAKPYDGPVALFYSNHGVHRFRSHYADPDFGVGKYYTGGFTNYFEDIEHTDFYQNTAYMATFAERLRSAIAAMEAQTSSSEHAVQYQLLKASDCNARLSIKGQPLFMGRAQPANIEVEVENASTTTWQPSDWSGIKLMVTWLDTTYKTEGKEAFPLTRVLAPGEKVTFQVPLNIPASASSKKLLFLQVDLVDDGVARFPTYGSKAVRFPTISSTLMLYPVIPVNGEGGLRWLEKIIGYRKVGSKSFTILTTNLIVRVFRKFRDLTYNLTEQ